MHWVNSFIKLHCYLTKGFEGGAPVTKPSPIGMARSKSEIRNFAGMRLTKELTKGISRGPVKFFGLTPLLNYTGIWQRVPNGGGPPLLIRALLGCISKFQISPE